jgi:hypothetical protein
MFTQLDLYEIQCWSEVKPTRAADSLSHSAVHIRLILEAKFDIAV